MARVKRGFKRRRRIKKVYDLAEGFVLGGSRIFRRANEAVVRAHTYAYTGRRLRKRDFRQLWITRISAAANVNAVSYNRFINGLKNSDIQINRKMLADIAVRDPHGFSAIATEAKAKAASPQARIQAS